MSPNAKKASETTEPTESKVDQEPSKEGLPAEPLPQPDWEYYSQLHQAAVWQAVALACNAEPECFKNEKGYFNAELMPPEFHRKLFIALNHIGGQSLPVIRLERDEYEDPSWFCLVRLAYFSLWAESMRWAVPRQYPRLSEAELAEIRRKAKPPAAQQSPPQGPTATTGATGGTNKWPWGNYETKLLRHLAAAVQEFWTKFDPIKPRTAPTNAKVMAWLKARNVGERNAQVIATIIRADNAPRGPRPIPE